MAVKKSVLEVDVQETEKFKAYVERFKKYQSDLKQLPAEWNKVGEATASSGDNVRDMSAVLLTMIDSMRELAANQNDVQEETKKTARHWESISKYIRVSGRSLKDDAQEVTKWAQATGNVIMRAFRWTGIATAGVGLAAGGTVWGLERLASSASAGRRGAQGLGIRFGQRSAFGLAYDRLIDSAAFLGGVSEARGNISSGAAGALFSLGINPAGPGNTGDVANQVLQRVRQMALETPEEQLGVLHQTRQLGDLGLGLEDLRRLKTMSADEFGQYQKDYERRTKQLDVSDKTLRLWQDFDVQLEASAHKLKTAFLEGLVNLVKPLGDVSEALSEFVKSVMGSAGFKWVIEKIADGIRWFADYVNKDEFKQDVKDFVASVEMLAKKTVSALKWLGLIPDESGTKGNQDQPPAPMLRDTPGHWLYKQPKAAATTSGGGFAQVTPTSTNTTLGWQSIKSFFTGLPWLPDKNRNPWKQSDINKTPGDTSNDALDAYARSIKTIESGSASGNYSALGRWVRGDRAYGAYQVMGANIPEWTRRALGKSLTPDEFLRDPAAQDVVFRHVFGEYVRKYGNPQDAASAWHSGRPLAQAGNAHDGNMYTRDYVSRFNQLLGQTARPSVTVNINNNTGGNATVTTSAMGVNNT